MSAQLPWENQYLNLVSDIFHNGNDRMDRTGTGTRALFGRQLDINLAAGFPAPTTKTLAFRSCVAENLWMVEGSGDERRLCEILHGTRDSSKRTIWTDNAEAPYWKPKARYEGDLGRVYGVQWRHWWNGHHAPRVDKDGHTWHLPVEFDQLADVMDKLKNNPNDRRILLSSWNPGELSQMALPPCHILAQFFVADNKLSCQMYQRSVDVMLGLPFDIALYALLTHMMAATLNMDVDRLIMNLGDTHIYKDHFDGALEQISRTPTEQPILELTRKDSLFDYKMEDFKLANYNPQPAIKFKMSV